MGTVALTLAERVEMKLTGRKASTVPGQVGARLSGHDPDADAERVARLDPVVHWAHGISMGTVRAGLDAAGMSRKSASVTFFPMLWAGDAALYAGLGIAPPPWRWSPRRLATDLFGKGVLASATSGAYVAMSRA